MGVNNSRIKSKNSISKPSPAFDPASDEEKSLTNYLLNDSNDIDRQHMNHFFKKYLFQNYFSSPIEDRIVQGGFKVLDVGCGPGTWLLSVSSQYENSHFVGLDINPLFPKEIKPSNLKFIEADVYSRLPFDDEEFDFVHMEEMFLAIITDKLESVFSELVRVTKRGGYIELSETYVTYDKVGPIFYKLFEGIITSYLKRNVDIKLIPNLDLILESHPNITKFHRDERMFIMGTDGGKIGLVSQDLFLSYCNSEIAIKGLSAELGISKEEYKKIIGKDLLEELKDTDANNAAGVITRIWTQKI